MTYPFDKFKIIFNFIIDNMESGYYHPDFMTTGRKVAYTTKFYGPKAFNVYKLSGETLYGLDRFAGHSMWYKNPLVKNLKQGGTPQNDLKYVYSNVYKFKNKDAETFWTTLDKLDARHKWEYDYLGGTYEKQLKELALKMMYQYFLTDVWAKLSDDSKLAVLDDDHLAANYLYTAWNGSGWVQKFSFIINDSIKKGITDTTIINQKLFNARQASNALNQRNGAKLQRLIPIKIKKTVTNIEPEKKKTTNNLLLGGLVPILIVLILFRKKIFK
jgi:hypothetical protein